MFFGFNKQQALLEEESVLWMFDVFDWALRNIGSQKFQHEIKLIFPNNEYFPGRVESAEGMAALIFSQVKQYAGIASLPCELVNEEGVVCAMPADANTTELAPTAGAEALRFIYATHTLNDPEVLIASYAHQIAYHIVNTANERPPGGEENLPHAAELVATVLGFGVVIANTANTQKIRSCGSCSGPAVERESFLSQYDLTYALAIFSTLKRLPVQNAHQHLKKSLRSFYKKSVKELSNHQQINSLLGTYPDLVQHSIKGSH
jgi:hypothetical protein